MSKTILLIAVFLLQTSVLLGQEVRTAKAIITGSVVVNGTPRALDGETDDVGPLQGATATAGTFTMTPAVDVGSPDDWEAWVNYILKPHLSGIAPEPWVMTEVNDSAVVDFVLKNSAGTTIGTLKDTFTVIDTNPLTYRHKFSGTEDFSSIAPGRLPFSKNLVMIWNANGTLSGAGKLWTSRPDGDTVQVTFSGTFRAQAPELPFPVQFTANCSVTSYDAETGAWASLGYRTCAGCQVPSLTQWGMIVLGVLILAAGAMVIVRRRKTMVAA